MGKGKNISFRDYFDIALWSLKVVWGISPSLTVISLLAEIFNGLRSVVNIYVIARLIDQLVKLATIHDSQIKDLLPLLLIFVLVNLAFSALDELRYYSNRMLKMLSRPYLQKLTYEKCNFLGPQTLELPEVSNMHQKMQEWLYIVMDISTNIVRVISAFVKILLTGAIVLSQIPFVVPFILFLSIIFFFQKRHFFKKDFDWQTGDKHLMLKRKSYWTSSMLTDIRDIGEITITGAFKYLDSLFTGFFGYYNSGYMKIIRNSSLSGFLLSIMSNAVLFLGYLQVFGLFFLQKISIGDTTFYMGSINNFYDGVQGFFAEIIAFRDFVMKAKEVHDFFELKPVVKDGLEKIPHFHNAPAIEIKNLSFHYPNSNRNVLEDFSLRIEAGQKIAIVGENGAGKTTLVKLISRIYDPQKGGIFINDINLRKIKLDDWYKNIGVLFQEFNFYGQLTVEENIYLGKPIKELDEEKIIEASKNADAHNFIMQYEDGYKTIMSERFQGGIRPSNGQKQKIAIARFFYRNAPIAIFDEPTSAIDAESEYRIFNRIYEFFENKTVIIISHRFSTVRNADRIIVIHEGRIVEDGTHEQLMAKGGRYFSAFTKQAQGYTD